MSIAKTIAMAMLPLLLSACGEYKQHVEYANGGFQGKQDQRAWDSEAFMHDPSVWRQVVHERNQRQNEYDRTGE